jgi:hypothetical protein
MIRLAATPLALLSLSAVACVDAEWADEDVGSAQSALTSFVLVEAEDAIGAGAVEADAAASGGQLRAFYTHYQSATATFTTAAPLVSGTVRIRATQCSSTPWVKVLVDGQQALISPVPESTWTEYPLSVPASGAGQHTIEFQYRWGSPGCDMRFDYAEIEVADVVVIEAEGAIGDGVVEPDAPASGGAHRAFYSPYQSATATFTTTGTMFSGSVRVRATQCSQIPQAKVWVDGYQALLTQVPNDTWQDYPLSLHQFGPGQHTITFEYRSGALGCDMRFDYAEIATD